MRLDMTQELMIHSLKEIERIKMDMCCHPMNIKVHDLAWLITLNEHILTDRLEQEQYLDDKLRLASKIIYRLTGKTLDEAIKLNLINEGN